MTQALSRTLSPRLSDFKIRLTKTASLLAANSMLMNLMLNWARWRTGLRF